MTNLIEVYKWEVIEKNNKPQYAHLFRYKFIEHDTWVSPKPKQDEK